MKMSEFDGILEKRANSIKICYSQTTNLKILSATIRSPLSQKGNTEITLAVYRVVNRLENSVFDSYERLSIECSSNKKN